MRHADEGWGDSSARLRASSRTDDFRRGRRESGVGMYGGIIACVCGVTVELVGGVKYAWATRRLHVCEQDREAWLEALAGDALEGSVESARLLPAAVENWLRS